MRVSDSRKVRAGISSLRSPRPFRGMLWADQYHTGVLNGSIFGEAQPIPDQTALGYAVGRARVYYRHCWLQPGIIKSFMYQIRSAITLSAGGSARFAFGLFNRCDLNVTGLAAVGTAINPAALWEGPFGGGTPGAVGAYEVSFADQVVIPSFDQYCWVFMPHPTVTGGTIRAYTTDDLEQIALGGGWTGYSLQPSGGFTYSGGLQTDYTLQKDNVASEAPGPPVFNIGLRYDTASQFGS